MPFHNMSSSETTGNFSAAHTQCFTENAGLQLQITVSAFPTPPHSDSGEGDCFRGLTTVRLRYDLLLCLPSLSELTGLLSSQRGRLLPGFRRFGHPRRRRISLQCQLGNLHWRDFHPLDHRLASLHYLGNPAAANGECFGPDELFCRSVFAGFDRQRLDRLYPLALAELRQNERRV